MLMKVHRCDLKNFNREHVVSRRLYLGYLFGSCVVAELAISITAHRIVLHLHATLSLCCSFEDFISNEINFLYAFVGAVLQQQQHWMDRRKSIAEMNIRV